MRQGNFSELLTQAKPVVIHNPRTRHTHRFPETLCPARCYPHKL